MWIRRGFSARDQASGLVRRLRTWSIPNSAREAKNPIPAGPEVLAEARVHFADHCALCHANDGSGQTEIG